MPHRPWWRPPPAAAAALTIAVALAPSLPEFAAGTDGHNAASAHPHVRCETTVGSVDIEVRPDWAPHGAERFMDLVRAGFWTNISFFRMNKWIVQFGAQQKSLQGPWSAIRDARIPDDPHCRPAPGGGDCTCGVPPSEGILFDGALSFAGGGKDSRTSQIFIVHNLADQPIGTDSPWEVPFGNVTRGLENVRGIYPGYGDTVNQVKIFEQGWEYLDKNFPLLDRVLGCREFDPVVDAAERAALEAMMRPRAAPSAIPPLWAAAVAAGLLLLGCVRPRTWRSLRRSLF